MPSPGDLPNLGTEPRFPGLQADSLPAEVPGKPKNTEVGSLSLLQGIFLTHESNCDLLHWRWILYQLSYQLTMKPSYYIILENPVYMRTVIWTISGTCKRNREKSNQSELCKWLVFVFLPPSQYLP